jgi:hypothetical protein
MPPRAGIVVVPQLFVRRSRGQLLSMNHNSNDLDMVESSLVSGHRSACVWGLRLTSHGLSELASTPIRTSLSEHCSL